MYYQRYKDNLQEWRWRFIATNGNAIAVSSEGYHNKSDCEHSISLVKQSLNVPVYEV